METSEFLRQRETFGLDRAEPWALPALRLLFAAPRVYPELVEAWSVHYPSTKRSLARLVDLGFVAHQPGVVLDTFTGEPAAVPSRRVKRYRATAAGARALATFSEDLRAFEEIFPRTLPAQVLSATEYLGAFVLEDSHARYGLSVNHAITVSGLSPRLARWWHARYLERGWLTELSVTYADVREVVPEHWRVNRALCRQIETVLAVYETHGTLSTEFHLKRSRFLADIDPSRVGLTGATDYDHDVITQSVLSLMLSSRLAAPEALFRLEPRLRLPVSTRSIPWTFDSAGADSVIYQPDALFTARATSARTANRRVVLEYERFQSRRDAWNHVERFLGWLHTHTLPFEAADLCFVVDTEQRLRTYVQLIEAFADHALDHPERIPRNPVTLAAITTERLKAATDPLSLREWNHLTLNQPGSDTEPRPVLHDPDHSPYGEYFGL